jgi:dipeptidyl-peptidase-4
MIAFILANARGAIAAVDTETKSVITPETISAQTFANSSLPQDIQWSPDARSVAFLQNSSASASARAASMPELWSANTATGKRSLLVSAAELASAFTSEKADRKVDDDDLAEPERLRYFAWFPNGRALLLASKFCLAWFDLDSRTLRSLVSGGDEVSDSKISPDGKTVAFIRDHAVWTVASMGGAAKLLSKPASVDRREGEPDWVYGNELGLRTAYWWSPDSAAIAYLDFDDRAVAKYRVRLSNGSDRVIEYPKPGGSIPIVHVYVQRLIGGMATEIGLGSASGGYLPRVEWALDGKQIAVERLSRNQKLLELVIADPIHGRTRVALSEKNDYWINLSDDFRFLKDSHRFLWSSERTGYRHLYLYDMEGHQLSQLTRGDWEVSSLIGVDETKGLVYFTATKQSPLERHVYRVGLDGSGLTQITKETGTHALEFSPDFSLYVDTYSNEGMPPLQSLRKSDGALIATISANPAARIEQLSLCTVDFLTVKTHMGTDLNAFTIKPPKFDPSHQYPVIVYMAGGPGEQVVRRMWGGDAFLWLQSMAQRGYLIFAMDNHGTAGRGHLFEEPIHLRLSSQEMADQRDGAHFLLSLPYVDKSRIGIYGSGYGGFLALHGMLDLPIAYKAGIAVAPISDWKFYDAVFSERYLEDPVRNQDGWLSSSPLENAKNLKSPLLVVQGTGDEFVHVENTLTLLDELIAKGKSADILLLPDRSHALDDAQAKLVLYRRLTEFFLRNL